MFSVTSVTCSLLHLASLPVALSVQVFSDLHKLVPRRLPITDAEYLPETVFLCFSMIPRGEVVAIFS